MTDPTQAFPTFRYYYLNPGSFGVQEAAAVDNVTTTSSTDVLLNDMTITPGNGYYMVEFQGTFMTDAVGDETVSLALYVNGVVKPSSRVTQTYTKNRKYVLGLQGYVEDLQDDQAVEVRWNTTGGTLNCYERSLIIHRINR